MGGMGGGGGGQKDDQLCCTFATKALGNVQQKKIKKNITLFQFRF